VSGRKERREVAIENAFLGIELAGSDECLWSYCLRGTGQTYLIAPPSFEVDGVLHRASLRSITSAREAVRLANGCTEYRFCGKLVSDQDLSLEIVFRIADENPVVRFRYILTSERGRRLTKTSGRDRLAYVCVSFANLPRATEVQFSEFNPIVHSYCLAERAVDQRQFDNELRLIGPMVVGENRSHAMLVAYEHGATVPDGFLEFALASDRGVSLQAVKGNYLHGQQVDSAHPYETIWLQCAAVAGDQESLAQAYRDFILHHMALNQETRRPYIYYNTWNYQERNKLWNGRPYLESMRQDRMLEEIEVAHRMGIDIFVIDTGWYERTGDWKVSTERFPDGLHAIRDKLEGYGMRLGLWFNPTVAAVSSRILEGHRDCIRSWRGKQAKPAAIWETEESHSMCLVSRYADAFAEELIRLHREVGVTNIKWDAVDQYGCDDPGHWHGGPDNDPQERADCYAFRLGLALEHIADRVSEACPGAIVDFDITEAHRYVGLGFLGHGKFYLVNNGPYYHDYNLPLPADGNWNMFFYPGPARGWICRAPLTYDKWIPSVLFMTHYLSDDPEESQLINIASLILGQNGIWGDLPSVSEEGTTRFAHLLGLYKQVREDITESYPVRWGAVGGSPEVHEKILSASGRGVVVIFSSQPGKFTYVTRNRVADRHWCTDGMVSRRDGEGRARLEADFGTAGAKIVFFGMDQP